jgi:hypothetical protein
MCEKDGEIFNKEKGRKEESNLRNSTLRCMDRERFFFEFILSIQIFFLLLGVAFLLLLTLTRLREKCSTKEITR